MSDTVEITPFDGIWTSYSMDDDGRLRVELEDKSLEEGYYAFHVEKDDVERLRRLLSPVVDRGPMWNEALKIASEEGKIPAIKFIRSRTGAGLKEGVEALRRAQSGEDPEEVLSAYACWPTPPAR